MIANVPGAGAGPFEAGVALGLAGGVLLGAVLCPDLGRGVCANPVVAKSNRPTTAERIRFRYFIKALFRGVFEPSSTIENDIGLAQSEQTRDGSTAVISQV